MVVNLKRTQVPNENMRINLKHYRMIEYVDFYREPFLILNVQPERAGKDVCMRNT